MKNTIIAILIILVISSCRTTKTVTSVTLDSTRVEAKIDTVFIVEMDTSGFKELLDVTFLLEGMVDSLENLPLSKDSLIVDNRSRLLASIYKKRYENEKKLRLGAFNDMVYEVSDSITIVNKDTTYRQPINLLVSFKNGEIGVIFNQDLKILSSETTTSITTKERKMGFIAWIRTKYTLYLAVILGILLFVIKIK